MSKRVSAYVSTPARSLLLRETRYGQLHTGCSVMSKLDIAKRDGMVELPNGDLIRSDLTHDEFRMSDLFANSRVVHATAGVADYQFGAGEFLGKRWRGVLSFFNQLLLHLDLRANFYAKGAWNRAAVNLNTEVETKSFHERILADMLGSPELSDNIEQFRAYELSGEHLALRNGQPGSSPGARSRRLTISATARRTFAWPTRPDISAR